MLKGKYSFSVDASGNLTPNTALAVRNFGDNSLATIYDADGAAINQASFTSDSDGKIAFWAGPGTYTLEVGVGASQTKEVFTLGEGFDTVAGLLADTSLAYTPANDYEAPVIVDDIITAGPYQFSVVASGATDNHVETAGGVKLKYATGQAFSGGTDGDDYNLLFCDGVLRRATSGDSWGWIADANHKQFGFSNTVTVSNNQIVLTPSGDRTVNRSVVVGPDETFAQMGMTVGASSGVGPGAELKINMAMPLAAKISATDSPSIIDAGYHEDNMSAHWCLATYGVSSISGTFQVGEDVSDGTTTAVITYVDASSGRIDIAGKNNATDRWAPLAASGTMTGSTSGATATIDSRSIEKAWCVFHLTSWTGNQPQAIWNPSNHPDKIVQLSAQRISGTETRVYPVGSLGTRVYYNGSAWATTGGLDRDQNGGNGWSFGTFNTGSGYIDVTHPEIYDEFNMQVFPFGSSAVTDINVTSLTTTGFRVYFKNTDGTTITSESTALSFVVNRGKFPLYSPWTGHFNLSLPTVTLDPASVYNANANLWLKVSYAESEPDF